MRRSIWLFAVSFAVTIMVGCDGAVAMPAAASEEKKVDATEGVWVAPPQRNVAARTAALSVSGAPIPYYIASAPPAISTSKLLKTIDTATRIWFTVLGTNSQGNTDFLFYETGSMDEAKVVFRYEDTDYSSNWDVRYEGGKVVFVMHRSVRQKTVVWENQPYLYYCIANFIGVDLIGKMPSTDPNSLTWRPGDLSVVTNFPHLPSVNDGAQVVNKYYGGRPLFTKKRSSSDPGYEFVLGWDSARKYEKVGHGIAFRGRVFPAVQNEQNYALSYVKWYIRKTDPKIGYYSGAAVNFVKYGTCRDIGFSRTPGPMDGGWDLNSFQVLDRYATYPGLEKSEITPIYAANFNQGMGFQVVYDVPRTTGCYMEAGGLQTGRGLPQ